VADVMMAVAKGPFAVFPGFPPDDGGAGEQKSLVGKYLQEAGGVLWGKFLSQFQSMLVWRVVVQAGAVSESLHGGKHKVAFCGMQIAG
jgi:hypothetical protein